MISAQILPGGAPSAFCDAPLTAEQPLNSVTWVCGAAVAPLASLHTLALPPASPAGLQAEGPSRPLLFD